MSELYQIFVQIGNKLVENNGWSQSDSAYSSWANDHLHYVFYSCGTLMWVKRNLTSMRSERMYIYEPEDTLDLYEDIIRACAPSDLDFIWAVMDKRKQKICIAKHTKNEE